MLAIPRRARLMAALTFASLVWMVASYGQSMDQLRDTLNTHLISAGAKVEQLDGHERRIKTLEEAHAADLPRMIRLEAKMDAASYMLTGMLVPVLLMGMNSILQLLDRRKKP